MEVSSLSIYKCFSTVSSNHNISKIFFKSKSGTHFCMVPPICHMVFISRFTLFFSSLELASISTLFLQDSHECILVTINSHLLLIILNRLPGILLIHLVMIVFCITTSISHSKIEWVVKCLDI